MKLPFFADEKGIDQGAGTSRELTVENQVEPLRARSLNELSARKAYTYKIQWESMPIDVMEKLELAESKKQAGNFRGLKLAIAKKLVSDYETWREKNPGHSKTPGSVIYRDITNQVKP